MSDTFFFLAPFAALIVIPVLLYSFTSYEAPPSIGASIRRTAIDAVMMAAVISALAWLTTGNPLADQAPVWLAGIVSGAVLRIAVDAIAVRREARRVTL